ncbi:hypothetical protein I5R65_19275 [Herbaspirillum sp. AP02]|uniref:hypothetical protein n=1 Tax=unclassified Herbaspirillum TaxID=2624150 RepID=UPI0015DB1C4F|nr:MULTISPECIES: hypothetical protein [unclassified Herbaspirillum]MBG7621617.1 hypothetical protein [Herbaspirillum sp. AP02]NZD69704.1 hypothetical protein [Herbaspirillum sp. AP21]
MSIEYIEDLAVFRDVASGEDAEALLGWLQDRPQAKLDLRDCTHIHPATLQVLLATQVEIRDWPQELSLRGWLAPLFQAGRR